MGTYETDDLKKYAKDSGLEWNQGLFDYAQEHFFSKAQLNQEQMELGVKCYTNLIIHLFDPKAYSLVNRVGFAFHFLFGKKPGYDKRNK